MKRPQSPFCRLEFIKQIPLDWRKSNVAERWVAERCAVDLKAAGYQVVVVVPVAKEAL